MMRWCRWITCGVGMIGLAAALTVWWQTPQYTPPVSTTMVLPTPRTRQIVRAVQHFPQDPEAWRVLQSWCETTGAPATACAESLTELAARTQVPQHTMSMEHP